MPSLQRIDPAARDRAPFGSLLRQWREARRWSQLDLALEADVSAKHVSFLETGRSTPSREMILRLAEVLDVPLRHRNVLLQAAGFASVYSESALDDPALRPVRRSIEFLLERHDPYPAVLSDRTWNVEFMNSSAQAVLGAFLAEPPQPPINSLRLLFSPQGLQPAVVNWQEVGAAMIQRLHREAAMAGPDSEFRALRDEILQSPSVETAWRFPRPDTDLPVVLPVHLEKDGLELRLFTAVTTLGTALDVTLNELLIETFLPADDETDEVLRRMVGGGVSD